MDPMMIVLIVAMGLGFVLLITRWGLQYAEKWNGLSADRADVARLGSMLATTEAELRQLRERVKVLERLATDGDQKLAAEINQLRSEERI